MCSPGRLIAAGLLTALAELLAAVALLVIAGPQQLTLTLAVAACLTAALSLAIRPLLRPRDGHGGSDDQGGDPLGSPPPEPPWWPDFERELRRYERQRRRSPV